MKYAMENVTIEGVNGYLGTMDGRSIDSCKVFIMLDREQVNEKNADSTRLQLGRAPVELKGKDHRIAEMLKDASFPMKADILIEKQAGKGNTTVDVVTGIKPRGAVSTAGK